MQRERAYLVAAGSCVGYIFLRLLLDGVLTVESIGIVLSLSAGLAVPLGVAFGVPGVIGLALGAFLLGILSGALSVSLLFYNLSVVLLAYFSHLLYRYGIGSGIAPDQRPVRAVGRFAFVAAIACSGSAAFLAFAYQIAGITPFYITVTFAFLEFVVATAVVAPVIGLAVVSSEQVSATRVSSTQDDALSPRSRWSLVVVPPLWLVTGFIGSIGFKLRERVSREGFQNFNAEFLYHAVHPDLFGQGGRRAQVLLGVLALIVIVASTRTLDRQDGGAR